MELFSFFDIHIYLQGNESSLAMTYFLSFPFFQLHYHYDYNTNIKGTNSSPAVTIDTQRVQMANYIQSDVS